MNLANVYRGPATVDPPRLVLDTPPAVEVWTSADAEVAQHLRLDSNTDSALVDMNLAAARKHFERVTGLCLITQTWRVYFDDIPIRQGQFGLEYGLAPSMSRFTGTAAGRQIVFPRAPLQSIDAFKYLDESGTEQTFSASSYTAGSVGVATSFGRLWLKEGQDWPSYGSLPGALRITFTAGFGDAATDVPADIRLAVLWLAAWWYEARLPVNIGNITTELPHHLDAMIAAHRVAFIA